MAPIDDTNLRPYDGTSDGILPCVIVTPHGIFHAEMARLSGIFVGGGEHLTELTVIGHVAIEDPFKFPIRRLELPDGECCEILSKILNREKKK